ncbi:hypothetical protein J9332_41210, partial [Aquimarina celericrescens]|nr:hypothetical protein [Aquimarina celericrescens]
TLSIEKGQPITLTSSDLTSINNTYQWYKNNIPISGATNKNLVISNATDTDAGVYHFIPNIAVVIDLALERSSITITVASSPVDDIVKVS